MYKRPSVSPIFFFPYWATLGAARLVPRRVLNIQNFPSRKKVSHLAQPEVEEGGLRRKRRALVLFSLSLSLLLVPWTFTWFRRWIPDWSRQIWFYESCGIVWKMWIIVSFWILPGRDSIRHHAAESFIVKRVGVRLGFLGERILYNEEISTTLFLYNNFEIFRFILCFYYFCCFYD